jgi:hypothetical protein
MTSLPSDRRRAATGAVAKFLDQLKAKPTQPSSGHGRLIFGLDATASRQPTWDRACRIQR